MNQSFFFFFVCLYESKATSSVKFCYLVEQQFHFGLEWATLPKTRFLSGHMFCDIVHEFPNVTFFSEISVLCMPILYCYCKRKESTIIGIIIIPNVFNLEWITLKTHNLLCVVFFLSHRRPFLAVDNVVKNGRRQKRAYTVKHRQPRLFVCDCFVVTDAKV